MTTQSTTIREIMASEPALFRRALIRVFLYVLLTGLLLFLPAGTLDWPEAWTYIGLFIVYYPLLFFWGARQNPGVLVERAKGTKQLAQPWDRAILGTYMVASVFMYLIAGLDAGRFGWSEVASTVKILGAIATFLAFAIPLWAVLSNPFASGVVRIQKERGQEVIDRGPYRFIRHPMYLGSVLFGFGTPVFLGSWWALIPGGIIAIVFMWRTSLEDRLLHEELPGYKGYAQKVRYRIFPGLW